MTDDITEAVGKKKTGTGDNRKVAKSENKIMAGSTPNVRNDEPVRSILSYILRPFESVEGKLIILGAFSVSVLSFVGIRRSRQVKPVPVKSKTENDFKKNIQLMREERFIKPIDPKLKEIRTNLYLDSRYLNQSNAILTETARSLNIAKTELILASRFNRHSMRVN